MQLEREKLTEEGAPDTPPEWTQLLSRAVLQLEGRSVAVLAPMWKGVDLRDSSRVASTCDRIRAHQAASINSPGDHPFELVFVPSDPWYRFDNERSRLSLEKSSKESSGFL